MIDQQTRLEVFSELLGCAGVALWHYDPQMNLLSSTATEPEMLDRLMRLSGGTETIRQYCERNQTPGFHSDFASLVYLADPRKVNGILTDIYVIGPVFTSTYSEQSLVEALSRYNLPVQSAHNTLRLLKSVSTLQHIVLVQYGRMLHRCLNGVTPELADIQPIAPGVSKQTRLSAAPDQEQLAQAHRLNTYALEQEIFQAVEDGNVDYIHPEAVLNLSPGTLSRKGPLRSAKNEIITCITLICRAAIRGGMPEDSAYTLADYYICMLEDSDSVSEVYQYSQDAFRDFTERVHKYKLSTGRSREVQACVSYLELHLNRKVQLKELSQMAGYNGNYLSTKFAREMGMSISDYTVKLKIQRAKVLLRNTNQSIQDICEELGFSSASYFSSLFKRETGQTPMEYRSGDDDPDA